MFKPCVAPAMRRERKAADVGDRTSIEWTRGDDGSPGATWNPLIGCSRVSPGCDHCYAIGVVHRQMSPQHVGLTVKPEGGGRVDWNGTINVAESVMDKPLRWKRPRRIFVNSLSDLFHPAVDDLTIARIFAVMALAPQHTFQVLTKRPQLMHRVLTSPAWPGMLTEAIVDIDLEYGQGRNLTATIDIAPIASGEPLPNVWLGVSIESDKYAWRADHLRNTPAAVRWISAEPLLGPLPSLDLTGIDWVVCGGESGPGARPMHPQWAQDLRDRCARPSSVIACAECGDDAELTFPSALPGAPDRWEYECADRHVTQRPGPAFLFKQWGDWAPGRPARRPARYSAEKTPQLAQSGVLLDGEGKARDTNELTSFRMPDDWVQMARVGKKAAGRELDGRTWDEYPAVKASHRSHS